MSIVKMFSVMFLEKPLHYVRYVTNCILSKYLKRSKVTVECLWEMQSMLNIYIDCSGLRLGIVIF